MEQQIIFSLPLPEFVAQIEATVRKVLTENKIESDKLLTSEEVMKLLNIGSTTLQNWRDNGKIPFTKVGKKIIYNKSQVLNALNVKNAA